MRIVLTGATGYIGGRVLSRLLAQGHEVCAIVRASSNAGRLPCHPGLRIITAANQHVLEDMLTTWSPEQVWHVASLFLAQHKSEDVDPLVSSNILFPSLLLEAMKNAGVRRFLNIGTSWEHFENRQYSPANLYAATKQGFAAILQYYVEACGFEAITLKFFDTYGPGDIRRKLFTLLRNAARSGTTLKMSPGEQLLDLVYIEDVVEAVMTASRLLEATSADGGTVYGVSSKAPLSLRDVVKIYQEAVGVPVHVEWGGLPYRPREVMRPWTAFDLVPGWRAKTPLHEGIVKMERDSDIGGLLAERTS